MNSSKEKRTTKYILIATAVVVVVFLTFLIGIAVYPKLHQTINPPNPPNVEVTSQNAREGFVGLDYVVYVDASVYNHGGEGTVTVWAELTQGENSWKKAQIIYLAPKQSKDLTFEFREVTFWSLESGYYRVWVTY